MLLHLVVSCELNSILISPSASFIILGTDIFGAVLLIPSPTSPLPHPHLSRLQGSPWEAPKSPQLKKSPHPFRVKHFNDIPTFPYHHVLSTLPLHCS